MSGSSHAVYGVGQLLVERQVTSAPPQMLLGSPLISGGSYHLTVTDGSAAPSYELDIRAASGFQNRLTGLQRDAGQQVHVPESALSPGDTSRGSESVLYTPVGANELNAV